MSNALIPFATQSAKRMKTSGRYVKRWPEGLVLHYTAGSRGPRSAEAAINQGISNGYTYLALDNDVLMQAHDVDRWGAHAGQSAMPGIKGIVNDEFIGLETCCFGALTRDKQGALRTWTGIRIEEKDARYVTQKEWGCPTGFYLKFSPFQEMMIVKTVKWLKENDPTGKTFKYEQVVGHHEVSGLKWLGFWRKQDPGGSFSYPMDVFRDGLINGWIK